MRVVLFAMALVHFCGVVHAEEIKGDLQKFQVPERIWALDAAAAARELALAAYGHLGVADPQLAYVGLPEKVPAEFTVALVHKGVSHDQAETVTTLALSDTTTQAWLSNCSGYFRWQDQDPNLLIAPLAGKEQRLQQSALIIWHLTYLKRSDVPADTPQRTGGAFSQGSSTSGLTLFTSAKDRSGGPIYRRHSESYWSSPQAFGPWYIAPLAKKLIRDSIENYRHPMALRRRKPAANQHGSGARTHHLSKQRPADSLDSAGACRPLAGHRAAAASTSTAQAAHGQLGGRDKALMAAARRAETLCGGTL